MPTAPIPTGAGTTGPSLAPSPRPVATIAAVSPFARAAVAAIAAIASLAGTRVPTVAAIPAVSGFKDRRCGVNGHDCQCYEIP
jgi:hypothetical protein